MKKIFSFAAVLCALTMAGCEDVPAPYELFPEGGSGTGGSTDPIVAEGDGSLESPYNIAGIIEFTSALEANVNSESAVYFKGVASQIKEISTSYNNCTFYLSDDGSTAKQFYVYRCKGIDGGNVTSETLVELGDTVVVYGKVVNYSGNTPETVQKEAQLVSVNKKDGSTVGGGGNGGGNNPPVTGAGSKAEPYDVASAMALTANANGWVKGYIVGYIDGPAIASDAKFEVPAAAETEVLIADAADCTDAAKAMPIQLPAGAIRDGIELSAHPSLLGKEILLYGSIEKYFGVMGLKSTSCAIVDGQTIGKDPEDTTVPNVPGTPAGEGTEASPYNVCKALTLINAGQASSSEVYVSGKICSIKEVDTGQYGNATFNISDDGTAIENGQLTIFRTMYLDGAKFTDANQIKVGDEVVIWGKLVLYGGTTPEVTQGGKIIKINGEGGNPNPDPDPDPDPDPVTSLTNGDFETWADGLPTGWKSACTASSATLSQSTDAHGGSYSVMVKGDASSNKRLAYEELTLEAGTYEIAFYAKSLGNATGQYGPQAKAGYTPVVDNKAGNYSYATSYTNLTTDSWTLVTYEFTLAAETVLCPLMMNPKACGDILVDDFTLTKK